jgi:hypothetical protein
MSALDDRPPEPLARSVTSHGRWYVLLLAASALSLVVLKLAPFLLVACFIAYLALPAPPNANLRRLCAAAALFALAGFVRFLIVEAMPGIVAGGIRATEDAAVSRLREILFAENTLRKKALIDPDGDHIGSAARIEELTGRAGVRGGIPLSPPLLEHYPAQQSTSSGPAVEVGGYLFLICVPKLGGGFTAELDDPVDEEAAERSFVAYAWPSTDRRGLLNAFFIDEHERILFAHSGAPEGHRARIGAEHAPSCEDAMAGATAEAWQVWRNKQARQALPGDRSP